MEQKLIKTGFYSFIIASMVGIIIFPFQEIEISHGIKKTYEIPTKIYLLTIIRFSSILCIGAISIVWLKSKVILTNEQTSWIKFLWGVALSFVMVFIGIAVLFMMKEIVN